MLQSEILTWIIKDEDKNRIKTHLKVKLNKETSNQYERNILRCLTWEFIYNNLF